MNSLKPYEINSNNVTQTWLNINSNSTLTFNKLMSCITGVTGNSALSVPSPISAFKWFTNVTYSYQGSVIVIVVSVT